jgi:hypothetical protein
MEKIEQETRVLKPMYLEEYPSKPYVFENRGEMEKFVKMVEETHYCRFIILENKRICF